mgnify:CR=1 FL=1
MMNPKQPTTKTPIDAGNAFRTIKILQQHYSTERNKTQEAKNKIKMRENVFMEKMYTAAQVAERYGVSKRTVWEWIRLGKLRAVTVGGRCYRVPADALADFERTAAHEKNICYDYLKKEGELK